MVGIFKACQVHHQICPIAQFSQTCSDKRKKMADHEKGYSDAGAYKTVRDLRELKAC